MEDYVSAGSSTDTTSTVPFVVQAGEWVELLVRSTADSTELQFQLLRVVDS